MAAPRVALVTGANRGIGLETSRQLLAKGLTVVLAGRDEAALEGSAEAVEPLRTEVTEAMDGKIVGLESYELVAQSW